MWSTSGPDVNDQVCHCLSSRELPTSTAPGGWPASVQSRIVGATTHKRGRSCNERRTGGIHPRAVALFHVKRLVGRARTRRAYRRRRQDPGPGAVWSQWCKAPDPKAGGAEQRAAGVPTLRRFRPFAVGTESAVSACSVGTGQPAAFRTHRSPTDAGLNAMQATGVSGGARTAECEALRLAALAR